MKHLTNRFLSRHLFSGLLLSGLLVSCTVGDTSTGVPADPEAAADAAPGGEEESDASVLALQWSPETGDIAGLKPAMHFVSPTEIYAISNNKISVWNGTAWIDHTLDALGMGSGISFVSPTQIYAVVGNRVDMWDGAVWAPMTPDRVGIRAATLTGEAEIHVVTEGEIYDVYAVIDNGVDLPYIAHSNNGGAWVEHTLPMEGLQRAISFVSPEQIYAVVGLKLYKWDGLAWIDLTLVDVPDLKPAIHAVSDLQIHANIGEKVSTWDGAAWVELTESMPGMHPVFHYVSDEDIHALAGLAVSQWAPVAP